MTDRERTYWRAQLLDRLDTTPMNDWSTTLLKAVCWIMDVALDRDQPHASQAPQAGGRPLKGDISDATLAVQPDLISV